LPLGVTFSFLISSPMVDLASLILLMSIFGIKIAVAYVLLGLVIAVAGGTLIEKLKMEDQLADFVKVDRNRPGVEIPKLKFKDRVAHSKDQTVSTLKKVFLYIVAGVAVGAVIHNWVPEEWIENVLGRHDPFGVILATIVGVPVYADIFGIIPVSEALLGKGALLGTVLSFMMAGTTLSVPSLVMLRRVVKPKLFSVFMGVCILGIVIVGYVFNSLQVLLI
ncbi:MAG: permease, partial [Clostridiales bacterium]|nr:permease [Clostridiales bacterium]